MNLRVSSLSFSDNPLSAGQIQDSILFSKAFQCVNGVFPLNRRRQTHARMRGWDFRNTAHSSTVLQALSRRKSASVSRLPYIALTFVMTAQFIAFPLFGGTFCPPTVRRWFRKGFQAFSCFFSSSLSQALQSFCAFCRSCSSNLKTASFAFSIYSSCILSARAILSSQRAFFYFSLCYDILRLLLGVKRNFKYLFQCLSPNFSMRFAEQGFCRRAR